MSVQIYIEDFQISDLESKVFKIKNLRQKRLRPDFAVT